MPKRNITREQLRTIPVELARTLLPSELRILRSFGWLPPLIGGETGPLPLGVQVAAGGTALTVDDWVNPPTQIPELVAAFTAENRGYWIEDVYNVPGLTVAGGAVIYSENYPDDFFTRPDGRPAPRAPGSEAVKLAFGRRTRKIARPESYAGDIEVHDEERRWNAVLSIIDKFRRAGNTFADILQASGEEALTDYVQASARYVVSPPGSDWAAADPVINSNSTDPRPSAEFARVDRLFLEDKSGIQPDLLITSPEDAEHLDRVYEDKLPALLQRRGLELRVSVRRPTGRRLYLKKKAVGTIAWDKPLDQEYTREGKRKTDVYTLEAVPVYVTNGADAVLEVRA